MSNASHRVTIVFSSAVIQPSAAPIPRQMSVRRERFHTRRLSCSGASSLETNDATGRFILTAVYRRLHSRDRSHMSPLPFSLPSRSLAGGMDQVSSLLLRAARGRSCSESTILPEKRRVVARQSTNNWTDSGKERVAAQDASATQYSSADGGGRPLRCRGADDIAAGSATG